MSRAHAGLSLVVLLVAMSLSFPAPARCEDGDPDAAPAPSLEERVRQLEEELRSVRGELAHDADEPAASPEPAGEEEAKEEGSRFLGIQLPVGITIYGYLKGDLSYDDSHTHPGDFVLFVLSENRNGRHANPVSASTWDNDDDEFNATANQSRFGLKFEGPSRGELKVRGKVEVDFYGGGAAENKPNPMLRHGFVEVGWPWFRVLAGQTWDLIGPANATTLNYPVLWDCGSIGYRRPQLRLTSDLPTGDWGQLSFQFALTRSIHNAVAVADNVNADDGEDAGWPNLQWHVGLSWGADEKHRSSVGFFALYGQLEADVTGGTRTFETWCIGGDLKLDYGFLALTGEFFFGRNLAPFLGGIGQGVAVSARHPRGTEIETVGGFAQLTVKPTKWLAVNVGHGIDDPSDGLLAAGMRARNSCTYGNLLFTFLEVVTAGVEVSWWETRYKDAPHGDALRVQTSLMIKF